MKQCLDKFPPSPDGKKSLKALKIVTIVFPAVFVFLLGLLGHTIFEQTLPGIWGALLLAIITLVTAFFFSRFVFAMIDRLREQRIRELKILNDVNQAIDDFHNLNALLNQAMDKLIQITKADSAELYLVDERSHELAYTLHSGPGCDAPGWEMQLQLKNWLMDESARLSQSIIVENLESPLESGVSSMPIASLAGAGIRSLAVVPLKSQTSIVGFACLLSMSLDHFEPNEANLLLSIGNRIAVAIEKARLYEKVQAIAVVEERERISAELHDGLAQVLGYVITKSQATRQLLRKMTVANDYLVELENVAQELYTDTREAILGLRTAISSDMSMVSALREYAKRFNQMHGIKTEFVIGDRIIPSLPPYVELQAIRIVQEALSNIRKHAEATRATIKLDVADDKVTIVVEDDGKGFDVGEIGKREGTRLGLQNMKERADSIHGSLLVESRPGNGTKVILSMPLTYPGAEIDEGGSVESTGS